MRIARAWTDVDGDSQRHHESCEQTHLTVASLRELIDLVEALQKRSR